MTCDDSPLRDEMCVISINENIILRETEKINERFSSQSLDY